LIDKGRARILQLSYSVRRASTSRNMSVEYLHCHILGPFNLNVRKAQAHFEKKQKILIPIEKENKTILLNRFR